MTNLATNLSNIRTGAFRNVRTCLLNVHADVGTKVYSSYPLKNISLPLITVENGLVKPDTDSNSLSQENGRMVTVVVTIFSKTAEKLDVYADAVHAALKAYDTTFETYGLLLKRAGGIEDNDGGNFVDINNNRAHFKSISVTFDV